MVLRSIDLYYYVYPQLCKLLSLDNILMDTKLNFDRDIYVPIKI